MGGLGEIVWSELGPLDWAFLACTAVLLLAGGWRLTRGDATPSPKVAPAAPGQTLVALLGLLSFGCLYAYLFSLPSWLTGSVQTCLAWLGADNHGSFKAEQNAMRFAAGLAAQLLIVGALLLQNRAVPGLVHARPDADDAERLALDRRGLGRLGGLFATCTLLLTIGSLLWLGFASMAESQGQPMPRELQPLVMEILHWHGPRWVLGLLFVSVTVGAPLMEEIGFRGILYPALRGSLPRGWAVALTGLLFGMAHGNLSALIPISAMGAWLCLVRDRFGLGTCILLHAMNNAWTVFWLLAAPGVTGKL